MFAYSTADTSKIVKVSDIFGAKKKNSDLSNYIYTILYDLIFKFTV